MRMKWTLLILGTLALALLVLAGCVAAAAPASTATATPAVGHASSPNDGLVVVTLEMDHAPRLSETVALTCTVRPDWDYFAGQGDLEPKQLMVWIELPPDLEVLEMPPGVTRVAVDDLPWNSIYADALEADGVVEQGGVLQFAVPVRFVSAAQLGWGGYTSIDATCSLLQGGRRVPGIGCDAYLDLTITENFSHFGYPEGYWEAPGYAEGVTPPPTPLPGQVEEEAVGTPAPTPPLPVITPPPYATPQL